MSSRRFIALALGLVALLHALPAVGVLGADRLQALYGIDVARPELALLLRHRAVLFGLLAALLGAAALRPAWHGAGLAAGLVSVLTFLLLAGLEAPLNAALMTVVWLDVGAGILLLAALALHRLRPIPT
jgi:hypothetical protein